MQLPEPSPEPGTDESPQSGGGSAWSELLLAAAIAAASAGLASWFDFHERLFSFTRRWETLQLDEALLGVFVFAACLVVLYARRHGQLRRELQARARAEAGLAAALRLNRELSSRTLDLLERERKHLARELHDEMGQYLNAVKLDARHIEQSAAAEIAASGARVLRNADHAYAAVRAMIGRLRPAGLDELGLEAALESLAGQWRASHPDLQVRLHVDPGLDGLEAATSLAIFRLVQEGLTNCVRHSGARCISIGLRRQAGPEGRSGLVLVIADDGVGIDGSAPGSGPGLGLAGMRERVRMLGGNLQLRTAAAGGLEIRATFPASGVAM